MNILKFIKWYMIDQYAFGIVGDPPADPPADPPPGDPPADPPADPPPGDPPADPPPGDPPADPPADPPTGWYHEAPDDWRTQIAGDDEKKLKRLERFTDFKAYTDNTFEEHDKLRAGEISTGLPKDATDEQIAEYREANNIPVDGKYDLTMPEGVEIRPEDQTVLDEIMPLALAGNVNQETLNALVATQLQARENEIAGMLKQDGVETVQREQFLRDEWKGDFDANMQGIDNLLNRELPEDLQDVFRQARGGDGKGLLNNPAVMMMLAKLERTINPMSTIPGGAENASQTARQIVDKAKALFKTDPKAYNDPAFQKQYDKAIEHLQSIGEKI